MERHEIKVIRRSEGNREVCEQGRVKRRLWEGEEEEEKDACAEM